MQIATLLTKPGAPLGKHRTDIDGRLPVFASQTQDTSRSMHSTIRTFLWDDRVMSTNGCPASPTYRRRKARGNNAIEHGEDFNEGNSEQPSPIQTRGGRSSVPR